jgi:hypothetical protein
MHAALERAGFPGHVDHDLVRLDAPAGLACVALGSSVGPLGYLCQFELCGPLFDHEPNDTRERAQARKAFYLWCGRVIAAAARAWPAVQRWPVPASRPLEPAPTPAPASVPQYKPRTDLGDIALEVGDRVATGRVCVVRATSEACGTATRWADAPAQSWQAWARPVAESKGCADAWDRCTQDPAKIEANRLPLDRLWALACDTLELPSCGVLNLRGAPEITGGGKCVDFGWLEGLARAIRRADRGITILVDCDPSWIARLLPHRVGADGAL